MMIINREHELIIQKTNVILIINSEPMAQATFTPGSMPHKSFINKK